MIEQILVFVSHTSDMRSLVDGAESAINAIDGAKARHMEHFPAADVSPAEYSVQQLASADIFVAIVGCRRGSTVPGDGRSYTELEFDTATELGKERLLFLLDPAAPSAGPMDPEQERFRRKLETSGAMRVYFSTVDGLKYEIGKALPRSIERRTRRPVATGGDDPDTGRRDDTSAVPPRASCLAALVGPVVVAALALAGWTAFAGTVPPWAPQAECSDVTAAVTGVREDSFGDTRGVVVDVRIDNRSPNEISVPAARAVVARGDGGRQYTVEGAGLPDGSWFTGLAVQPESSVDLELGIVSGVAGSDTVTLTIPRIRGAEWLLGRCRVTLDPVAVTFGA